MWFSDEVFFVCVGGGGVNFDVIFLVFLRPSTVLNL